MNVLRPCLVVTAFLLIVCCVVYPVVVTGAAQAMFPNQANGSVVHVHGADRGSSLIGQTFEHPERHPEYFWGRPTAASVDSATGVTVSSGSNQGPLSQGLHDDVSARIALLRATGVTGPIPVDLVTKSASGLDPDISPAAAMIQVPRVAAARHIPEERLRGLVNNLTHQPILGLFGSPRVNVLALNLSLDGSP